MPAKDRYLFDRVAEAQMILDHYLDEYNDFRPHSSLGYLTPVAYRQQWIDQTTLTSYYCYMILGQDRGYTFR
mgnify:CR=1 FL=1